MRRFRQARGTGHVNCEALMRAAGQNLKRLLKKHGWVGRPCQADALQAPLFCYFCVMYSSFLAGVGFLFVYVFRILLDEIGKLPTLLMSFMEAFSTG